MDQPVLTSTPRDEIGQATIAERSSGDRGTSCERRIHEQKSTMGRAKIAAPGLQFYVVPLTVIILVALFAVQSRGTASVASFSPAKSSDHTGTYKMKEQGAAGLALVQQTADGRIKFYINATYRTNTGEVSGEIPMGKSARYVDKELDCTLSFNFSPGSLVLSQDGSCGMGLNVSAAGTYKRVSSDFPKFEN